MPKDKLVKDERPETPQSVEYPFRVRSVTARDVQKVPGSVKYASRETGTPYMTIDLDWPGVLTVEVPGAEGAPDPKDPDVVGLAFKDLLRWVNKNAADVGREVVADIRLDRADAALGDVSNTDMDL